MCASIKQNRERVCHSESESKKTEAESLKLQLACFQIGLESSWVVVQINSVYDSTANVIIISTRILGCSEENTAKPKLRNTQRLDYIYFICYFYNYFTLFHLTHSN